MCLPLKIFCLEIFIQICLFKKKEPAAFKKCFLQLHLCWGVNRSVTFGFALILLLLSLSVTAQSVLP